MHFDPKLMSIIVASKKLFFGKKLPLVYPKVKEKLSAFLFSLVVRFSVHCYWSTYLAKRQHFYSCDFIQNKPQVTLKYSAEKFSRSFKPYKFSYEKKNSQWHILAYFFALSSSLHIFTKNRNSLLLYRITSFNYVLVYQPQSNVCNGFKYLPSNLSNGTLYRATLLSVDR